MALTSGLDSLNIDQATDQSSNQMPDQAIDETLIDQAPTKETAAPQVSNEEAMLSKALDDHQKQKLLLNQQIQKMSEGFSQRQNQFIDPKLAAMSAAFLDPGKTGSFGEAFGRAVKGYSEAATDEDKQIKENARMRLDLMKTSISENEKSLIAQLTPKLFKVDEAGAYTGEIDPVVAQKIVSISGDPSMIQKIIEMSRPQIGEISPGGSTYDKRTGKIISTAAPKATEFSQDLQTLSDLKAQLAQNPNNEDLKSKVKTWENYIIKKSQWEPDAEGMSIPKEVLQSMATQALSGDTSVFQNLGRGAQGAKNIIELRQEIDRQMKLRGMTPQDIAAANAEFFGFKAGQRSLGTRGANIELASQEFLNIVPLAKDASDKVSRSGFLPFGKVQVMFNEQVNDPNLAEFAAYNNGIINTYARAISPTGIPTVSDKMHARKIITEAKDKKAYEAAINALALEIEAAKKSPLEVRQSMRKDFVGGENPPAAPANKPADGKHYLNKREIVVRGGKWVYADTGEVAQ